LTRWFSNRSNPFAASFRKLHLAATLTASQFNRSFLPCIPAATKAIPHLKQEIIITKNFRLKK